jgi:competence protein ComEA
MGEKLTSFLSRERLLILLPLLGAALVLLSLYLKKQVDLSSANVQVLETPSSDLTRNEGNDGKIAVDVRGEVSNPGLYYLREGSRVDDAILAAGGLTGDADKDWVDKNLNRAGRLNDGQKIFIPSFHQTDVLSARVSSGDGNVAQSVTQTEGSRININSATLGELDSLPGIGQVYGQKIIDNRPYSDVGDLVNKGVLRPSVFEKIKDKISVY